MLLGLSSLEAGAAVDFAAIVADDGDIGVTHGRELVAFVDAVASGDTAELDAARATLVDAVGPAGMLETAAVIGNFTMMTRIADSTGTPLDAGSVEHSADLRADMGLDRYVSARLPA